MRLNQKYKKEKRFELPVYYSSLSYQDRRVVRTKYIKEQKGLCYYCKSSLHEKPPLKILNRETKHETFPKNFLTYPIHLHHCHNTDLTLGAVHAYCNGVLWQYEGE